MSPCRKKRIAVVFGTRPEAIKLAPVILELSRREDVACRVCVTGQHREMLHQVLDLFGIVPDVDLALMRPNQELSHLAAQALEHLDAYLASDTPDLVLVQGDTTTTFCGALASFHRRIPVGHVEAGLRTGNLDAPWPEEANRIMTTTLATLHFTPTTVTRANLLREGVPDRRIFVTGNPVIDALLFATGRAQAVLPATPGIPRCAYDGSTPFVLITGHRRESFGPGFERICQGVATLAARFPEVHFIYPVHLNPNVREPVFRILAPLSNVHLVEPLEYLPFIGLMMHCRLVLTDSGGVQEEAPSLGKPVLVMRETTERPEALTAGASLLVGTTAESIVAGVSRLLTDKTAFEAMASVRNPYGDGHAAARIVDASLRHLASEFPR